MPRTPSASPVLQCLESRCFLSVGQLDNSFGNEGVASIPANASDARLTDVAVTPDGRIVVTGTTAADGTLNVARFRVDGLLDPTFGVNGRATSQIGSAEVRAVAVQPDHKIIVVGSRGQDYFVLRYNTNGKHDRAFGDGGLVRRTFGPAVSEARDLAILDDGSILVAGTARQANGSTAAGIARFEANGTLDQAFGDNGTVVTKFGALLGDAPSVFVNRMAVRENVANDIVLAGRFTTSELFPEPSDDALAVMRLHSDGLIDPTFSGDGLALADFGGTGEEATGVAIDAEGLPVVSVGGVGVLGALRLRSNGARDTSFGRNGLARFPDDGFGGDTRDVLIEDGRIVLAGKFGTRVPGTAHLARLQSTGEPDADFGTNGLSASLPFAALAAGTGAARVLVSPDQSYVAGGTGSTPARLSLAKVFVEEGPAGRLVSAPDLRAVQAGSYVFHVEWRESGGVNVVTIGDRDLRVTGSNGYLRSVRLVSPPTVSGNSATARYKIAPPNDTAWNAADNGVYTIHALDRAVEDLQGVGNPSGVLGTFRVDVT